MCDPLTIAGIALTGASTVANSIAQGQVNRARNDALQAERIRQASLDSEAQALNAKSQDSYKDFSAQQDDKASELGDYFKDQKVSDANSDASVAAEQVMPQSGSALTVKENQKQADKATAYTDQQAQALGTLRSFGDLLGSKSIDQAKTATLVGQLGGFKQGSSNVLPYELEAANEKGSGLKLLGDVLGLGGSLVTSKGLSGTTTYPTTLGAVVGATPTVSATSVYPKAPTKSLFNLYGN